MHGQSVRRSGRLPSLFLTALALGLLAACGGRNPTGPSPGGVTPAITSISPGAGSTLGGTVVTIVGANFSAGAVVAIGGVAATTVNVISASQLTATTGQHAAGVADVVVIVSGRSGSLRGAFTYTAPKPETNTSPVIQSIVAQGTQKSEPADFADVGETVAVTASVSDKETPPDQLTYEWSADVGTFSGSGAKVSWKAPASGPTPLTATLTLTVIEKYQTTDDTGLPVDAENRVTDTAKVSVHDSVEEVGDMATLFLVNFSKSSVPVDTVMKDFSSTCRGTTDEREQVQANRENYVITAWSVGSPDVTVKFGAGCQTHNGPRSGDACSDSAVEWKSKKSDGTTEDVAGVDQIAAVFLSGRWWLCSSDFDGNNVATGTRFEGWQTLRESRP
jgi:IPT/TIG domain